MFLVILDVALFEKFQILLLKSLPAMNLFLPRNIFADDLDFGRADGECPISVLPVEFFSGKSLLVDPF